MWLAKRPPNRDWRPAGPIAASAACREGGAMRRPEGTRRERSGGGMPRWGSCEAAGVKRADAVCQSTVQACYVARKKAAQSGGLASHITGLNC